MTSESYNCFETIVGRKGVERILLFFFANMKGVIDEGDKIHGFPSSPVISGSTTTTANNNTIALKWS